MITVRCWKCQQPMIEDTVMIFGYEQPAWFCPACHATFPMEIAQEASR